MTYVDHTDGSFSLSVGNRSVVVKVDGPEEAEVFREWLAATPALSEDGLRDAAQRFVDCDTPLHPNEAEAHRADIETALRAAAADSRPAEPDLDAIRDEVREAVIEGDANDCTSPDCIADAVYEILRFRLASTEADQAETPR